MTIPGYTLDTVDDHVGRDFGVSDWTTVDQARIDQFAAATGDHQWIHVDVDRAKRESPSGATIAHGFLTLSTLAGMTMQLGVIPTDASRALNYGIDRARFLTPVTAGQRIRTHVKLAGAERKSGGRVLLRITCTVEIEGESKPAVVADLLSMVLPT
jgi:acyl dehydratase